MNAPVHIADPYAEARFDTEVQLLGALLHYQTAPAYHAAAAICGPEHFSDNFNSRVFARIGEGIGKGLYGFPLIHWLVGEFRDDTTLTQLGKPMSHMVARYVASACPEIGIEGCARQIRHDSLSVELKMAVEDGDTAAAETVAAEMERLSKAHLSNDEGMQSIGDIARKAMEALSDAYSNQSSGNNYAKIGLADLAQAIGGWRRKRLYIIAGRPGMGKSTFTLSTMLRTAHAGHGVLFFAQEMGKQELVEMALCDIAYSKARIEYRDISSDAVLRDGFADKFAAIHRVSHLFNSLPLMISDRGGLTVSEIRSQAHQYGQRLAAMGKRLDVIVVDHMGLVAASSTYKGNKVAETEEVSAALKQLAKELDCAVVALSQLSRQVESREDKRPNLSDLRWSGGIEQDADVVMFVYREAYYLSKREDDGDKEIRRQDRLREVQNKIEVLVEKNRGGPTRNLEFFCDVACSVVRDLEAVHHG